MQLTVQQLGFFETFGFIQFPGLLADRIDQIIAAFDDLWGRHGGGHHGNQHDGERRSCIVPFIDQDAYLCSLLDDPRIHGIATSLMGDDYNYFTSDGNYYVGDTRWHSDAGWKDTPYLTLKMALYLDPLTRETGALRVIPGSHRMGDRYADALQKDIRQSQELWGVHGRDVPAYALETKPGDLVIFNHRTKHGAFGGSARRRMFTLNYTQRFREEDIQIARDWVSSQARFWIDRMYTDTIIQTASPERLRHLEQFRANDDHLPALAQKARQDMAEPARG